MDSDPKDGWFMDEVQATHLITWPSQILSDDVVSSDDLELNLPQKEDSLQEKPCSRKRFWAETCTRTCTKASREKMRRDKLNHTYRFIELCSILDPGRPPKTDKIIILGDAFRLVNQLRLEAQKLKETNIALQDTIKSLKAEKIELRHEKVKLKIDKEGMKQVAKGMSMPSPFPLHPAFSASDAAFTANDKGIPYSVNCPQKTPMWQWMAPAFVHLPRSCPQASRCLKLSSHGCHTLEYLLRSHCGIKHVKSRCSF